MEVYELHVFVKQAASIVVSEIAISFTFQPFITKVNQ